jgi:RNA polymerase sigma-70 factor (ECF subfamily)
MPAAAAAPDTGDDVQLDIDLVRRSQSGDTRAFDALVTKYRGRVYAMAYHLVQNETEAWDLAQEAFIKAWRALPGFKGDASFYTWLFRITHNVAYDWLRKKKIRAEGNEFDDSRADHGIAAGAETAPRGAPAPDTAMKQKELGQRIRGAIGELSPDHQQAILLREVEGLSYDEIAQAMACSLGTVMSRLFYARKKLQEILHDLRP